MPRIACTLRAAALAAALAALLLPAPARASCATRHFYNHSNYPWVFALTIGTCSFGPNTGHICLVPAGQTANIDYSNGNGSELIIIGAWNNRTQIYNQSFNVDDENCYISHRGPTGNAYLNASANGDVSTCSGSCT